MATRSGAVELNDDQIESAVVGTTPMARHLPSMCLDS